MAPLRAYYGATLCEARAVKELAGLGDADAGEWREWTGRAFHLRRRLTLAEQEHVGPVMDIRRTPEALRRAAALGDRITLAPPEVIAEELGS